MLSYEKLTLGPVSTNTYILADAQTGEAAVIDPAWDGLSILEAARRKGWRIGHIWLTHAHFDHLAGAGALADAIDPPPPVALHPADHALWKMKGGAGLFGMDIDPGPEPTFDLVHGTLLRLGSCQLEVRHAPGHTRGHVIFYCAEDSLAFCGDVIFQGSVGRTDLPGGDYDQLIESIRVQVLSLPGETCLLCGHGPDTSVDIERLNNPFLV